MSSIRKQDAPTLLDEPEITGRYVELDDYTVSFETFHVDTDPAPLFRGLPDDRCQCPHWGVVLNGRVDIRYVDHDETLTAGDAYYVAPGHLPRVYAGTEVIEFSPTEALHATMAVLAANMASQAPVPS